MNTNILLLTILMSLVTVGAQLLMKKGLAGIDPVITDISQLFRFVGSALSNSLIIISLVMQALGFVLWMYLVSNAKLALITTVSGAVFYILISVGSFFLFGENLAVNQWIGILLVTAGIFLILIKF